MTRNFYLSKTNERATEQVHPLVLLHRDRGQLSQFDNPACRLVTRAPRADEGTTRSHGTRGKTDHALFPSGGSLFERSQFLQALIDISLLIAGAVGVCAVFTAVGLILLFVRLKFGS